MTNIELMAEYLESNPDISDLPYLEWTDRIIKGLTIEWWYHDELIYEYSFEDEESMIEWMYNQWLL